MKYRQNYNVETNLKINVHITYNTESKNNFLKRCKNYIANLTLFKVFVKNILENIYR